MAYVDLNPIRAGMADRPVTSDFTSLQERLGIVPEGEISELAVCGNAPLVQAELMPFGGKITVGSPPNQLPFNFMD